jgi:hypothetical protein
MDQLLLRCLAMLMLVPGYWGKWTSPFGGWHSRRGVGDRSVSGEGHLTVNFPPPKEASTRVRLLIVLGVSVVIKIITNSTSDRIKTI